MKIYTKGGDRGETSLIGGARVPKSHARLEAYGTLDELNSQLGVVRANLNAEKSRFSDQSLTKQLDEFLFTTQNQLFNLGSLLACEDPHLLAQLPQLNSKAVDQLEQWVDDWDSQLRTLKNFILPGGSMTSASLHVARTLARRAEREVFRLSQVAEVDEVGLIYLNRLSDTCFVAARLVNQGLSIADVLWEKNR